MTDTAIIVESLSKRYRIGMKEQMPDTLVGAIKDFMTQPIRNFRKLRRLTHFDESPEIVSRETGDKNLGPQAPSSAPESPIPDSRITNHGSDIIWALRDVSFEVKKGEVVGIIGRNGAGKSTLLKILARITEPTSGRAIINGRIGSLLEVGTGMHPELTGRENIYLSGTILGMTKAEIDRKFEEIVEFAELGKFIDTPVKKYSSGMAVRLGFAIAAHLEPEILLVDEVLAVGDAAFQKKCLGKMGEVAKEGRTVLFVSHNMHAIERLCNQIILLNSGIVEKNSTSIKEAIKYYLRNSNNCTKTSEWINPNLEFQNPYFTPIRFAVVDENGKSLRDPIPNNRKFYFLIEGHVEKVNRNLNVGYVLFDESNNLIYESYFTDSDPKSWPQITEGRNILTSRIPERLLNEGEFRVEISIWLHHISGIVIPNKNSPSIFFSISGGLSDSPFWMKKRPGILAPVFQWENVTNSIKRRKDRTHLTEKKKNINKYGPTTS